MTRALTALTIGPFDPRGRDGILADIKAFSALGLHGAAAITSTGLDLVATPDLAAQLASVLDTPALHLDAVKVVCPASADHIEVIADVLKHQDVRFLVVDPADAMDDTAALESLKARLLPLAYLAIPNVGEATTLSGQAIETWDDMRDAARTIAALGPAIVVIKGGKRAGKQVTDLLFDGQDYRDYTADRVELQDIRGTGTTFAAAITATLAKGETIQHSIAAGKAYVTKALQSRYATGGATAMHHFYRYWQPSAS
jgi:hydroxymethylpyrimidine/phosphomethylpyrimidine kinase